jgi:transposase InsO family protein
LGQTRSVTSGEGMKAHKNARTTHYSRQILVERIAQGLPAWQVAQDLGVSRQTVQKWLGRARAEGPSGLTDRSSRPTHSPTRLSRSKLERISALRLQRLNGEQIAERLRLPRSTVARHLSALGMGKLPPLHPPPAVVRYEREHPGELIHIDTKKLGRFQRLGHRVTGNRHQSSEGAGWDYLHVCVDDASRLAYVEIHPNELRYTATRFLIHALRFFRKHGVEVQRVMTDNAGAYRSKPFLKTCHRLRLQHKRTRPYTPRTNGKAERFIQTLLRQWAYQRAYPNSGLRNAALPGWLHRYNHQRPHASLGRKPPISRLASRLCE